MDAPVACKGSCQDGKVPELPDPFDRARYPRLAHREWVLMYQRGVRVDQIARANQRKSAYVLRYLVTVYERRPTKLAAPVAAAEAAEETAVPKTEVIIPLRRPILSTRDPW